LIGIERPFTQRLGVRGMSMLQTEQLAHDGAITIARLLQRERDAVAMDPESIGVDMVDLAAVGEEAVVQQGDHVVAQLRGALAPFERAEVNLLEPVHRFGQRGSLVEQVDEAGEHRVSAHARDLRCDGPQVPIGAVARDEPPGRGVRPGTAVGRLLRRLPGSVHPSLEVLSDLLSSAADV
jgi:hypothetical protein